MNGFIHYGYHISIIEVNRANDIMYIWLIDLMKWFIYWKLISLIVFYLQHIVITIYQVVNNATLTLVLLTRSSLLCLKNVGQDVSSRSFIWLSIIYSMYALLTTHNTMYMCHLTTLSSMYYDTCN